MRIDGPLAQLRGGSHETYPVATAADVSETESAIGRPLPESYRQFVTAFSNGAYLYLVEEVAAVGEGNEQIVSIQRDQWHYPPQGANLDEAIPFREGGEVKYGNLVPFHHDHNGNQWCFITNQGLVEGEYPVAYFDRTGRKLYGRQASFGSWLELLINDESEVIRGLYEEDVLADELQLG
jgi:hypothetical protein